MMRKLTQSFYERDTTTVAKELLGKYLIHHLGDKQLIGRIVEVEAYLGQHDLASHSSKGLTKRTEVMFGPAGFAYIYLIYGRYYCTNIVTEKASIGSAILIRALEPIKNLTGKTQGPGLLSHAMQIDLSLNRHDLQSEHFYVAEQEHEPKPLMVARPRIGVSYAKEWAKAPLRFYIKDNAFVSKP